MRNFVLVAVLAAILIATTHGYISCGVCDGRWVTQPDGKQCVSVVKSKCSGLSGRTTHAWTRGTNVWDNCYSIPSQTAIATFSGPGNKYNGGSFQHAAIFIGCESNGIRVHDQWVGKRPPGCTSRVIRSSGSGVNRAGNYYTIEL